MITNQHGIGMLFSSFYQHLFTSSNPSNIDQCLSHIYPLTSDFKNDSLMADFIEEKIKVEVFQMNELGAPRPDGFPAFFY